MYILLTLCQRNALTFATIPPTDLVLPTEIMNAFLFCETWQRNRSWVPLHIRKGNGKRGNSYQLSDFSCTWQLLYCREQNQVGHTFLYPLPNFLSTDLLIPRATSAKIVSIYSVVKKLKHQTSRYLGKSRHRAASRILNTLRTGSFKLFKRPFPGFLTILTL